LRQAEEDRIRNHAQKTKLRKVLKQARAQLAQGETIDLKGLYSEIDKVGGKGIIHRKRAARLKSRLTTASTINAAKTD
jgi:ribosomal protein S20